MKLDIALWSLLSPYPGTELYGIIASDSRYRFIEDWRRGVHCNSELVSIFESDDYPARERIDMFYYANIITGAYGNIVNSNTSNFEKVFYSDAIDPQIRPRAVLHPLFKNPAGIFDRS